MDMRISPPAARFAIDGLVVGIFSAQLERAEHSPLDVVGQAGQDLRVIILAESVQVRIHGTDVLGHV
jgi:hypothetical protein